MILTLDAVFPAARPALVLIPPSVLLLVFTATLKLDSGTILTTEPAPVFLDTTLIQPRPSSAMLAQLFTARSATPPTLLSATLAPLEPPSTTSLRLAHAQLVTSSMEPPASNALTTVRPAARPTEPAPAVLIQQKEISLKIASASMASMTQAQLTALLARPLALLAPTELAALLAMPQSSET